MKAIDGMARVITRWRERDDGVGPARHVVLLSAAAVVAAVLTQAAVNLILHESATDQAQPLWRNPWLYIVGAVVFGVAAVQTAVKLVQRVSRHTRWVTEQMRLVRDQAVRLLDDELVAELTEAGGVGPGAVIAANGDNEFDQMSSLLVEIRDQVFDLIANERTVRSGNIGVLVNLSRRCQTLIGRQLAILEKWEQGEISEADLRSLFTLDHLATRMRRVNENMVLLSGQELHSRSRKPAELTDVLQAAAAEIEQYERVRLGPQLPIKITAGLIRDLVRMLAELLENATSFSPPNSEVAVDCRILADGNLSISILDSGIGMSDDAVEQANDRLTKVGPLDLVGARCLGLFVVGRIAGRHGLAVALSGGSGIVGVRAMVTIPAAYVLGEDGVESQPLPLRIPGTTPGLSDPAPLPAVRPRIPTGRRAVELPEVAPGVEDRPLPTRVPGNTNGADAFDAPWKQAGKGKSASGRRPDTSRSGVGVAAARAPRSGWFTARRSHAGDSSNTAWKSSADSEWRIVETVNSLRPERFAENGLPQRVSGEFLMPGGIGTPDFTHEVERDRPDPDSIRRRLDAFRSGLAKQRGDGGRATAGVGTASGPRGNGSSTGSATASWFSGSRSRVPREGAEWMMLNEEEWKKAQ